MDSNEKYFNSELKKYLDEMMKSMKERVMELFKQAIDISVYSYYDPSTYRRTYQLLDSVAIEFDKSGNLLVYVDTENMAGYFSAVDGRDIPGENVAYWVQQGHQAHNYIPPVNNEFHNYESRLFLQKAEELIKNEFPDLKIKIISNKPKKV